VVKLNKAIFLDRDGVIVRSIVINKKGYAPRTLNEFRILPLSQKYCKILKKKNFKLILVTNQPDVDKGLISKKVLNKMHQILKDKLKLDAIYTSFSSSNKSYNRKPNPGMLIKAKKKYKLNMDKCFLIGDRRGDILAADKLNCRSVFIDRKYREIKPITQVITVKSFPEAVKYIINKI
jgi:D-glycero-D-manno-heptose 1,7-bisphosphate phosphatase